MSKVTLNSLFSKVSSLFLVYSERNLDYFCWFGGLIDSLSLIVLHFVWWEGSEICHHFWRFESVFPAFLSSRNVLWLGLPQNIDFWTQEGKNLNTNVRLLFAEERANVNRFLSTPLKIAGGSMVEWLAFWNSESSDPSSSLGGTWLHSFLFLLILFSSSLPLTFLLSIFLSFNRNVARCARIDVMLNVATISATRSINFIER